MRHRFGVVACLLVAGQASAFDCPSPPPGMVDIQGLGYYRDAAKSVVDERRRQANTAMVRPLADFNRYVAALSDTYLAQQDAAAGACAIAWLDRWAQDGALLGRMVRINNDQADYYRQWLHAGLGIVYFKTRPVAPPAQRSRIDGWMHTIATRSLGYWNKPQRSRNNHYYWTGVGMLATAIATEDTGLRQQAHAIYSQGIADIQDDGSLPMEMRRQARALHYHNFALQPLVLMAEMARAAGEDWYGERNHRIDLLAERVAAGYQDSSWFAQQAGQRQEPVRTRPDAGWAAYYQPQALHPEHFAALAAAGPFFDPRAGGDTALMSRLGVFNPP